MKLILGAILGVPALIIGGLLAFVLLLADDCGGAGISADPTIPIAEYSAAQVENAAAIVNAGRFLGVNSQAQMLAVMTALGESDLVVLDHGDGTGPDGRGLFQQPDNGAWGSLADRLDPMISATNFYQALLRVDGWESLAPSLAAHRVQGNADPHQYERFLPASEKIMRAFGSQQPRCGAGAPGEVNQQGWALPSAGAVSSGWGSRELPCTPAGCPLAFHRGIDIVGDTGSPIYAAHGGVVVAAGPNGTYGNWIYIDHLDGTSAVYAHMYTPDIFVRVGQNVRAGQNIAMIGCSGVCTGPHLHFETRINGTAVDPISFMRQRGVTFS